jgi:hypothetical protein
LVTQKHHQKHHHCSIMANIGQRNLFEPSSLT